MPRGRLVDAGEAVHDRRLARPVVAHERDDLAGIDVDRQLLERDHGPELLADALGSDQRRDCHGRPALGSRRVSEIATSSRTPWEIICSDEERPERIRPFVKVPSIRLPAKAPMTLPSPPNSRVPPITTAVITISRSCSPSV